MMTMGRWVGKEREIKYWKELKRFLEIFAKSVTRINKIIPQITHMANMQ